MKMDVRFMRRVAISPSGCWEWTGSRTPRGYGHFGLKNKTYRAHRVSYERFITKIPDGLTIDHLCCKPSCVNPVHLEPVTNYENVMRGKMLNGVPRIKPFLPGTGVGFHKDTGQWQARFRGKWIGIFKTKEEAMKARTAAELVKS